MKQYPQYFGVTHDYHGRLAVRIVRNTDGTCRSSYVQRREKQTLGTAINAIQMFSRILRTT